MSTRDNRQHDRIDHPFTFHFNQKLYIGNNFSLFGIGVKSEPKNRGDFCFYRGQVIRDGVIELEGQIIRVSKLRVCWLEMDGIDRIYGLKFDSILEPEHQKVLKVYKKIREGKL